MQNVIKLTLAPPDPILGRHPAPAPELEVIGGDEHYVVEKILDSRIFRRKLQYKVRWEGYDQGHDSWAYATDVFSPDLVAEFHATNPRAPKTIQRVHSDPTIDWEMEKILAQRYSRRGHQLLVKWKGLSHSFNSWECPTDQAFFCTPTEGS